MEVTRFIVSQRDKALLVGDYGLYRKRCSRRLLTLRRKLGRASPKGRKYAPNPPITPQEIASNHEFIELLLLTSERAWAHAMHMKSIHSAESADKGITGSTRQHIISRIHKATIYAARLVQLVSENENLKAKLELLLEARAYFVSLIGAENFEKQNWELCLKAYSEAKLIYMVLAQRITPQQHDLYRDLLSGTIDPSIRYAAYQMKLPRSQSVDDIMARHVPRANNEYVAEVLKIKPDALSIDVSGTQKASRGEGSDAPQTISWRSRTVNLEDARIAQALASVHSAEQRLSAVLISNSGFSAQEKAAAYDDVLLPSQDAVDATKTAIDELTSEGVASGDKRIQALQITRTAVNYDLVSWRIGRNRILCGSQDGAILDFETTRKLKRKARKTISLREGGDGPKLARLRERVVLYDSILQSLESVHDLPGVAADRAFVEELEAKRAYFAALKCLTIARSHAMLSHTRNALALFDRGLQLSLQTRAAISSIPSIDAPAKLEITTSQIDSLQHLLQGLLIRHRALAELENLNSKSASTMKSQGSDAVPLIQRLHEFPQDGADLTNLVCYPPKLQPIPVKPIFLDVAWNYIEYPGRERQATKSITNGTAHDTRPKERNEGRRGWFGFGAR